MLDQAQNLGDVAARIQSDPELKKVPVVFLTALVSGKEARGGPVMRAGYRFLGKLTSGADLIRCIEENLTPITLAEDGLQTLLIVKAMMESARRGASVKLPAMR